MAKAKKIILGEQEFNLLPCPAIGLKEIGRNFGAIGSSNEAGIDALVSGIYYGVKRGLGKDDTSFTREFVEWNIDTTNLELLAQAFADVNDAVKKEGAPGEAQAAS
jgi:hypothetical protein